MTLPLVALSSKIIYGQDLLALHGIDWKGYGKLVGQRASAQRVDGDRKAYQLQQEQVAQSARGKG